MHIVSVQLLATYVDPYTSHINLNSILLTNYTGLNIRLLNPSTKPLNKGIEPFALLITALSIIVTKGDTKKLATPADTKSLVRAYYRLLF